MTLIALYVMIGCLLARDRVADIAAEGGDRIVMAAKWVITWPWWVFRT